MKLYEAATKRKPKEKSISSAITKIAKTVFAQRSPPLDTKVKFRTRKRVESYRYSHQYANEHYEQVVTLYNFPDRALTKNEKGACSRYLRTYMKKTETALKEEFGANIEYVHTGISDWKLKGQRTNYWDNALAKETSLSRDMSIDYIMPKDAEDSFPAAISIILSLAKSFKMTPREVIAKLIEVSKKKTKKKAKKKVAKKKRARRRPRANRNRII